MKKQIKISQKHSGAGVVKSFIVKYIDPDKLNMWSDTGRGEDGRYDGRTVRMVDATGYYIEDMTVQYLKNCREHGLTAGDELYDEDTDTMSHAFILNTEEIDQIIKFVGNMRSKQ